MNQRLQVVKVAILCSNTGSRVREFKYQTKREYLERGLEALSYFPVQPRVLSEVPVLVYTNGVLLGEATLANVYWDMRLMMRQNKLKQRNAQ